MSATSMKDPVCGMSIETADAAAHTEYKGQTYYFCSTACKTKFDAEPDKYATKSV
ncbi:MAG: YHS domain-containing protein [Betaproteobacteria bacterium]